MASVNLSNLTTHRKEPMDARFSINPEPTDSTGTIFIHTGDKHLLVFDDLAELDLFAKVIREAIIPEIRENYPNVK